MRDVTPYMCATVVPEAESEQDTLHYFITGERGIIHTKTVILIAELALARKIIVTDLFSSPPGSTFAPAMLMLALGITCWLMRERDDRIPDARAEP